MKRILVDRGKGRALAIGFCFLAGCAAPPVARHSEAIATPAPRQHSTGWNYKQLPVTPTPPATSSPRQVAETPRPAPRRAVARRVMAPSAAELEQRVLGLSPEQESSVTSLAAALAPLSSDPAVRARLIYRWIADRISYDGAALQRNQLPDPAPEVTLARRTAVCGGYAYLYTALAEKLGLEVCTVRGKARTDGFCLAGSDALGTSHAWNAVKFNGRWHLLDATWGAGSLDEQFRFERRFDPYYFDVPPRRLLVDHYPAEVRWQLLGTPLKAEEYLRQPHLLAPYDDFGLVLQDPPPAPIECRGRLQLRVGVPAGVVLMTSLQSGETECKGAIQITRQGSLDTLDLMFPAAGEYRLNVYARRDSETSGECCFTYKISCSGGSDQSFPEDYGNLQRDGTRLRSPRYALLPAGKRTTFDLTVPGARAGFIGTGEQRLELKCEDGRLSGDLELPAGEATVFVNRGDDAQYQSLLTYQVR